MSKIFKEEIINLFNKFKTHKPFAFSKYADGEWLAMTGHQGISGCGEWTINDGSQQYEIARQRLINSFQFKDPEYFVGISCPCCQGQEHIKMKTFSQQDEDHLTFANIFVNSNYDFYLNYFIPEFTTRKIYLVANRVTNINNLPFTVEKFFPIDYNAWVTNLDLIEQIKNEDVKDALFLFSAGPFGNILCSEIWKVNKNNTYLDVGSTLDPWTNANKLIGKYYTNGSPDRQRVCVWG